MPFTWDDLRRNQAQPLPQLERYRSAGQVTVVTGGNTGIGYEIARYLAANGAERVIIACRNEKKGTQAGKTLTEATGRAAGVVKYWPLDLASLASVRSFARRLLESGLPLHLLVNNAAVNFVPKMTTEDGLDLLLQVDHLAPLLLSILLFPALERAGNKEHPSRCLWVSSELAGFAPYVDAKDGHPIRMLNQRSYEETDIRLPYHLSERRCCCSPSWVGRDGVGAEGYPWRELQAERSGVVAEVKPRTREEGARNILVPATYPVGKVWGENRREVPLFIQMEAVESMKGFSADAANEELKKIVWNDSMLVLGVKSGDVDSAAAAEAIVETHCEGRGKLPYQATYTKIRTRLVDALRLGSEQLLLLRGRGQYRECALYHSCAAVRLVDDAYVRHGWEEEGIKGAYVADGLRQLSKTQDMVFTHADQRKSHEHPLPALESFDLSGQVVIITGANVGIGYECARYMLTHGVAKIIAACRNERKTKEAIRVLLNETKREEGAFEYWHLDLASFASVRAFAAKYLERGLPLNTLLSNAAVAGVGKVLTEDGLETHVQVNHISPTYLAMLLYPALKRTGSIEGAPPARIVGVSSEGAFFTDFPESASPRPVKAVPERVYIPPEEDFSYFNTKLLNVIGFIELARRIPASANIKIAVAGPGLVNTELGTKDAFGKALPKRTRPTYGTKPRSAEDGAKTILVAATYPVERVWAAGDNDVPFFSSMKSLGELPVMAQDEDVRKRVWKDTLAHIPLKEGEVDGCFV
ncbi:hypothetical protein EVG20_g7821 [Dentipellis fragilis]|uniref:Uncharacterized protein n=1 Tax=Dentipellis fragilis TaxID=205917 RepID=A0A4Y9YD30_9AGAM|nr:hypothetical protein EVG20_g7821 [Dentipellis fragilis]